jgi:hypothetical protein
MEQLPLLVLVLVLVQVITQNANHSQLYIPIRNIIPNRLVAVPAVAAVEHGVAVHHTHRVCCELRRDHSLRIPYGIAARTAQAVIPDRRSDRQVPVQQRLQFVATVKKVQVQRKAMNRMT